MGDRVPCCLTCVEHELWQPGGCGSKDWWQGGCGDMEEETGSGHATPQYMWCVHISAR